MRKWLLILGLFCSLLTLQAQDAKTKQALCDSLSVLLEERGGVRAKITLKRILKRSGRTDWYFKENLGDYPFRQADIPWLQKQLKALAPAPYDRYPIDRIYVGGQAIENLVCLPYTRDGKAGKSPYSLTKAPAAIPALVRKESGEPYKEGLAGRHIAVWNSHGQYYNQVKQCWLWQRAPLFGTLEDVFSTSFVLPFLVPMLENAGAVVLSPRERDPQPREVVCDNDPAFSGPRSDGIRLHGRYTEKGWWSSAGEGFADARAAYQENDNPFRMGTARKAETCRSNDDPSQHSTAIWRPDIPEKGPYAVYVSYKTLPNITQAARYTVRHLGGETVVHVNQRMGGGTWVYLGTFLFGKGTDGCVMLSNISESAGVVTADAVRFGGGMGKQARGGAPSGMPAYAEAALYSYIGAGMDCTLLKDWEDDYRKDISCRGIWVNEMRKRGVPVDLALALHSDAGLTPNDSIIGTLAIYTLQREGSDQLPDGSSRLAGRLLGELVQSQVVEDVRREFEPQWTRRELLDRSYVRTHHSANGIYLQLHVRVLRVFHGVLGELVGRKQRMVVP